MNKENLSINVFTDNEPNRIPTPKFIQQLGFNQNEFEEKDTNIDLNFSYD